MFASNSLTYDEIIISYAKNTTYMTASQKHKLKHCYSGGIVEKNVNFDPCLVTISIH